jgi:hypothetical protein
MAIVEAVVEYSWLPFLEFQAKSSMMGLLASILATMATSDSSKVGTSE